MEVDERCFLCKRQSKQTLVFIFKRRVAEMVRLLLKGGWRGMPSSGYIRSSSATFKERLFVISRQIPVLK